MPHHDLDRFDRPFDWEREQVFDGYDPLEDGFAYPFVNDPEPDPRQECYCTQDPASPHNAIICDPCMARLELHANGIPQTGDGPAEGR